MLGKIRPCLVLCALTIMLSAVDDAIAVGSTGLSVRPAAGWVRQDSGIFLLRGPGKDGTLAPRFVVSIVSGSIDATVSSIRTRFRRVVAGNELLSEDDVPLGGRAWHRLRTRLAMGPLVLSQSIWISSVRERTVIAVLSSDDDRLSANLTLGSDMVASLRDIRPATP